MRYGNPCDVKAFLKILPIVELDFISVFCGRVSSKFNWLNRLGIIGNKLSLSVKHKDISYFFQLITLSLISLSNGKKYAHRVLANLTFISLGLT